MSSGSNGAEMQALDYARELAETRSVLNTAEVVGYPRRAAELVTLEQLVERYPNEARGFLAKAEAAKPPEPEQG